MCNSLLNRGLNKDNSKNLILSFSLLMRIMEWCHEDARDDVDMHKVMEKLVAFSDGVNPLNIDVYDCLIAGLDTKSNEKACEDFSKIDTLRPSCCKQAYASNEDLQNAYDLGQEYAENDIELSSDGGDYSLVAGEIITDEKDNGYGASNAELEQFWQGYDDNGTVISLKCVEDEYDTEECEEESLPSEAIKEIEKIISLSKGF
jgi:hypothetical protein